MPSTCSCSWNACIKVEVCLSAKVNENASLGQRQDWGQSWFQCWGFLYGNLALPNLKSGFSSLLIYSRPKLPLNGRIYTLTTGTILNTNVFHINLGKLLFRATFKVRVGSCLSLLSKWKTWTVPKLMHDSKIYGLSMGGAHSRVEAYSTSPTSPPYVGKQLTALFHTQPLFL